MTEEMIRAYCDLRAQRLALNNAQRWAFTEKVVQHWSAGEQAESALKKAAEEVGRQ